MSQLTRLIPDLVGTTTRAPSSHITHPWCFVASGTAVELYADRSRRLPVNDPEDRELPISCGAALFTLRVAAAHHGVDTAVTELPDRD